MRHSAPNHDELSIVHFPGVARKEFRFHRREFDETLLNSRLRRLPRNDKVAYLSQ